MDHQHPINDSFDCIVIGGGPAGSTTAALTAQAGYSTLLVERESMPRFHVGESLMPETYWTLRRLGVLEQMKQSDFVKKVSVQFIGASGKESQPFFFNEHDGRECSTTWQVERSRFDQMLFENAAEKGAQCRDETRVLDVLFDEEKAVGVRSQTKSCEVRQAACRVVVDATGQQAFLANRLQLRRENPKLKKAAIWGYYRGARREPGQHGGATIIMHTRERRSWFWFIPLSDDITSIGVVGDYDYLLKNRGKPASVFEDELVNCPGLTSRLMSAKLTSPLRVAKEFSYTTTQRSGPGWVLVGDAYGFIDPIYSSGVFLALRSGELAADAIIDGLSKDDLSGKQLGAWSTEFDAGVQWISKLVGAYYTDSFSFGHFMKEHPQHQGALTDLLIGRVFHESAGRIFQDMDPLLEQAAKEACSAG